MSDDNGNRPKLVIPGDDMSEEATGYQIPLQEAPVEWTTCFVVGLDEMGVAHVTSDVATFAEGKTFKRPATANDIWLGAAQVARDLEQINVAQRVMQNFMMAGAAIQQQAENEEIARKLKLR